MEPLDYNVLDVDQLYLRKEMLELGIKFYRSRVIANHEFFEREIASFEREITLIQELIQEKRCEGREAARIAVAAGEEAMWEFLDDAERTRRTAY